MRHAIALFAVSVLVPAAAGQTGSMGLITPPRADSCFREKGIIEKTATIGLIRVRFAGGTEWTYRLEAKGRFDEQLDPALRDRGQALRQKHFPDKDMSWAFPRPGQGGKVSTCRK